LGLSSFTRATPTAPIETAVAPAWETISVLKAVSGYFFFFLLGNVTKQA
jgi:hypothetical protein